MWAFLKDKALLKDLSIPFILAAIFCLVIFLLPDCVEAQSLTSRGGYWGPIDYRGTRNFEVEGSSKYNVEVKVKKVWGFTIVETNTSWLRRSSVNINRAVITRKTKSYRGH